MMRKAVSVGAGGAALAAAVALGLLCLRRPSVTATPYEAEPEALVAQRMAALLVHEGTIYGVEDHFLYASADTGRTYTRLGVLPKAGDPSLGERLRNFVARSELVRRIRRAPGPTSMAILASGTILVFYDRIYRSTDGGNTFEAVPGTSTADGLPAPFPGPVGNVLGGGDTLYYGEYITDPGSHAVRVVRGTDDGRTWTVAHTFEPGEVRHVHSISYDPYRGGYWIAAGDVGPQIRLMYTDDHFATVRTAGCCAQRWRVVDAIITEEALFWGSDDDQDQPAIYRFEPEEGTLTQVAELDNPSYAAALLDDGSMAVTTTFESDSPYTLRSEAPRSTSLYRSEDGVEWRRVLTLAGDSASWSRGERPQMWLPAGDPLPALVVTPWHTLRWAFSAVTISP